MPNQKTIRLAVHLIVFFLLASCQTSQRAESELLQINRSDEVLSLLTVKSKRFSYTETPQQAFSEFAKLILPFRNIHSPYRICLYTKQKVLRVKSSGPNGGTYIYRIPVDPYKKFDLPMLISYRVPSNETYYSVIARFQGRLGEFHTVVIKESDFRLSSSKLYCTR